MLNFTLAKISTDTVSIFPTLCPDYYRECSTLVSFRLSDHASSYRDDSEALLQGTAPRGCNSLSVCL